jgi:hypothetical protein
MPVNTAALKTFAPAMRRQLLETVGRKLDLLLNSQTPDTLSTYAKQIAELREQEAENREQIHRVRFIASWYWRYAAATTNYFPTFLKASMMPASCCCPTTC